MKGCVIETVTCGAAWGRAKGFVMGFEKVNGFVVVWENVSGIFQAEEWRILFYPCFGAAYDAAELRSENVTLTVICDTYDEEESQSVRATCSRTWRVSGLASAAYARHPDHLLTALLAEHNCQHLVVVGDRSRQILVFVPAVSASLCDRSLELLCHLCLDHDLDHLAPSAVCDRFRGLVLGDDVLPRLPSPLVSGIDVSQV